MSGRLSVSETLAVVDDMDRPNALPYTIVLSDQAIDGDVEELVNVCNREKFLIKVRMNLIGNHLPQTIREQLYNWATYTNRDNIIEAKPINIVNDHFKRYGGRLNMNPDELFFFAREIKNALSYSVHFKVEETFKQVNEVRRKQLQAGLYMVVNFLINVEVTDDDIVKILKEKYPDYLKSARISVQALKIIMIELINDEKEAASTIYRLFNGLTYWERAVVEFVELLCGFQYNLEKYAFNDTQIVNYFKNLNNVLKDLENSPSFEHNKPQISRKTLRILHHLPLTCTHLVDFLKECSFEVYADENKLVKSRKTDDSTLLELLEKLCGSYLRVMFVLNKTDSMWNILINKTIEDFQTITDAQRTGNVIGGYRGSITNEAAMEVLVQFNGLFLNYGTDEIKDNEKIVMLAVKQNGLALKFASRRLANDKEVVMVAMNQNSAALEYAHKQLKGYVNQIGDEVTRKQKVEEAVEVMWLALDLRVKYYSEFADDSDAGARKFSVSGFSDITKWKMFAKMCVLDNFRSIGNILDIDEKIIQKYNKFEWIDKETDMVNKDDIQKFEPGLGQDGLTKPWKLEVALFAVRMCYTRVLSYIKPKSFTATSILHMFPRDKDFDREPLTQTMDESYSQVVEAAVKKNYHALEFIVLDTYQDGRPHPNHPEEYQVGRYMHTGYHHGKYRQLVADQCVDTPFLDVLNVVMSRILDSHKWNSGGQFEIKLLDRVFETVRTYDPDVFTKLRNGYFEYRLDFVNEGEYFPQLIKYLIQYLDSTSIRVSDGSAYRTLEEAVKKVSEDPRIAGIIVGEGTYELIGDYLEVASAMNIVGDPDVARKDIVIKGGIKFKKGISVCRLKHLTIRAKFSGVHGCSSFTMEDVLVKQCKYHGVQAQGVGVVGRCTDVEVRQCGYSGVVADGGASITLIGAKTTVLHNCTKGYSGEYGLKVRGASTIQLVSPLTKEIVSVDNGGGGNWDADDADIKTVVEVHVSADCTLEEAVDRVHGDDRLTTIVVGEGDHEYYNYLEIPSAMNIVGDIRFPKSKIVVMGGIRFKIPGCRLKHLTIEAEGNGVIGRASFTMEDVVVQNCEGSGVVASGTGVVGRCTNVEVRQCQRSGVLALYGASITLVGPDTKVYHNCVSEEHGFYGLDVSGTLSTIRLVSPLTKEQVSFDNQGNGDWGAEGGGDIRQIKTMSTKDVEAAEEKDRKTVLEVLANRKVRVPEDCPSLKDAVMWVHRSDLLEDIVVGKGEHHIDGNDDYLDIRSAMNIVGDPDVAKEEIVVVGGIRFKRGIPGCHLQHLTLRRAKKRGVLGLSSFTMEDVLVEQCDNHGVLAYGTVVARCTNVEVRQCGGNGVCADMDASITLIGDKTTVHHNCTDGDNKKYGLKVYGPKYTTIKLVYPLTKEIVSVDNGGGRNWGAGIGNGINQIKTISQAELEAETVAARRGEVRVPEDRKTLKEAVDRVQEDDRLTTIVVGKGEHMIDGKHLWIGSTGKGVNVNIVGDPAVPRDNIVINGGILIDIDRQYVGNCHLQHLTLRQTKGSGVWGRSSFTMEDVLVEQCDGDGVKADGYGVVGRCTNVEVRQCGGSGVFVEDDASITLIGAKTTVHHNCTNEESDEYGLQVDGSSTIQLVSPLTKEQVALDNGGGGNWGGDGIETIARGEVHVPVDCKTLKEAVERVHEDDRLTTIVVGKGEHKIDGDYLEIPSAMHIVGDPKVPKGEIVVVGGISFEEGIQGNCHLQHLTLHQATVNGVVGESSFTMDDVIVEQCSYYGVVAIGTGVVGRCTNVEVHQCGGSGVVADSGASITLIGAKTTVHHNCTNNDRSNYGLTVSGSSSTIQLVSPLTKEKVSHDNVWYGGGGNWGANYADINQIKTILPAWAYEPSQPPPPVPDGTSLPGIFSSDDSDDSDDSDSDVEEQHANQLVNQLVNWHGGHSEVRNTNVRLRF